jgi:hypothetical protein
METNPTRLISKNTETKVNNLDILTHVLKKQDQKQSIHCVTTVRKEVLEYTPANATAPL